MFFLGNGNIFLNSKMFKAFFITTSLNTNKQANMCSIQMRFWPSACHPLPSWDQILEYASGQKTCLARLGRKSSQLSTLPVVGALWPPPNYKCIFMLPVSGFYLPLPLLLARFADIWRHISSSGSQVHIALRFSHAQNQLKEMKKPQTKTCCGKNLRKPA